MSVFHVAGTQPACEADAAVKGTIADVPSYVHEQLPVA